MNWFERLLRKAPEVNRVSAGPEVIPPIIFLGSHCGFYFEGQHPRFCDDPGCNICHPMTRERAAEINERFLRERGPVVTGWDYAAPNTESYTPAPTAYDEFDNGVD